MNPTPTDSARFLLRPVRNTDLDVLERFAADSPHGLTSLPLDRTELALRIQRSLQSFATDDASGEEAYLFVLEDGLTGQVIGISGIAARAGFGDRFYSFRNEFVVHRSQPLAVSTRIHTLHLCHDLTGVTLLTSFYIEPAYEHTIAPQLLSRARLLFIAEHPTRFSDRVAVESPGLSDDQGQCPFWDAVGRRFFGMDYPEVERLAGGRSKSFIADLMPPTPVYVPLLPEEAQWAVGQLHPMAELPFAILQDEGFDADTYVDIFDGGPTAQERLLMLKTVSRSVRVPVQFGSSGTDEAQGAPPWCLLASTAREEWRSTLICGASPRNGVLMIPEAVAGRLALAQGQTARACLLEPGR